jgi:hypothetical protein
MSSGSSPAAADPAGGHWAGPSRRARAIAAALAIVFAALTVVVVSLLWKRVPPAATAPTAAKAHAPVEVQLISPRPANASASGH